MTYAVIMAGGIGSRFWPMSRRKRPKQFLSVVSESTLIQSTVARLQGIVEPECCYVVTHERYVDQTFEQLPAIPRENILAEPISRNTAPCITYAAMKLIERDPDATMIVLPADHVIKNVRQFQRVLRRGVKAAAEEDALITIGIEPTHPATGYGYIQFDTADQDNTRGLKAYWVKTFAEKPDVATAERFLDSGDFLWNSGMFIWRAQSILNAVSRHLPKVADAFAPLEKKLGSRTERSAVKRAFTASPSISIDYGVMERAEKVYVVPGSFGWSDVGDWRAVYDFRPKGKTGNVIGGNVIVHDSSRCLVQADGDRLIALVGIHDAVVIDTADATLVCHRGSTQQVKNVVDYLYAQQLDKFV
jgi:mannose-1-phosphate guanylyltransferase